MLAIELLSKNIDKWASKIINKNLLINIKPASIEIIGREIKQNREVPTISARKSLFETLYLC